MSIAAVPPAQRSAPYDGTTSFPDSEQPVTTVASRVRAGVTTVFVVVPFAWPGCCRVAGRGPTGRGWPTSSWRLASTR